jgi:hypothetical protein
MSSAWLLYVGAAGALVALLAVVAHRMTPRCPKCRAFAGRAFAARGSLGTRMKPRGDSTPDHRWRRDNPATGWMETSYGCRKCKNEWNERVERG